MTRPLKVLFIAGWGRSGSTLLDRLLGQMEGWFSAGEVRYLWDRGILARRPCACGAPLPACEVWSRAAAAPLGRPRSDVEHLVFLRDQFRSRDVLRAWTARAQSDLERHSAALLDALAALYRDLAETTGARVVVDSSKFPSHGFLLDRLPGVDLRVLHLVRDPRAVAHSWQRRKVYDASGTDVRYIERHGAWRSTSTWSSWNAAIELLWGRSGRYLRLRYEDLVRAPRPSLEAVASLAGEKADLSFFTGERTAALSPGHLVAGNPARFESGEVTIAPDDSWREEMRPARRAIATLGALPLLLRYGYPLYP